MASITSMSDYEDQERREAEQYGFKSLRELCRLRVNVKRTLRRHRILCFRWQDSLDYLIHLLRQRNIPIERWLP